MNEKIVVCMNEKIALFVNRGENYTISLNYIIEGCRYSRNDKHTYISNVPLLCLAAWVWSANSANEGSQLHANLPCCFISHSPMRFPLSVKTQISCMYIINFTSNRLSKEWSWLELERVFLCQPSMATAYELRLFRNKKFEPKLKDKSLATFALYKTLRYGRKRHPDQMLTQIRQT